MFRSLRFAFATACALLICGAAATAQAGPDLRIEAWASDLTPIAGNTTTITVQITNGGDATSPTTTVRLKRGSQALGISQNSLTVASLAVPTLVGSTSVEHQFRNIPEFVATTRTTLTFSFQTPNQAGTYTYGACVVPVAGETNTANNCSAPMALEAYKPSITLPNRSKLGEKEAREALELKRPPLAAPALPGPQPDPVDRLPLQPQDRRSLGRFTR